MKKMSFALVVTLVAAATLSAPSFAASRHHAGLRSGHDQRVLINRDATGINSIYTFPFAGND